MSRAITAFFDLRRPWLPRTKAANACELCPSTRRGKFFGFLPPPRNFDPGKMSEGGVWEGFRDVRLTNAFGFQPPGQDTPIGTI